MSRREFGAARPLDPRRPAPGALTGLRAALLDWYDREQRPLPWRLRPTPYRVWVAEIMLQQTRVDTVIPYFERFLRRFPTVTALASAPLDAVLKHWAGLGYYARARRLHEAARIIVYERRGVWPDSAAEWRSLPGVGRYTAAAIASITRAAPEAVVDGNVKRVLARLMNFGEPLDRPAGLEHIWRYAQALLDPARPGDFNQALMELGAAICTPRHPRCPHCPWRTRCAALQAGLVATLPRTATRRRAPRVTTVALAIRDAGRWLLVRRPTEGPLGGLWRLPGSDVRPGETVPEAVRRVLAGLGCPVVLMNKLGIVTHEFTHRRLRIHLWLANRFESQAMGRRSAQRPVPGPRREFAPIVPAARTKRPLDYESGEQRWVSPAQLALLALAKLDQKLIGLALNQRAVGRIEHSEGAGA